MGTSYIKTLDTELKCIINSWVLQHISAIARITFLHNFKSLGSPFDSLRCPNFAKMIHHEYASVKFGIAWSVHTDLECEHIVHRTGEQMWCQTFEICFPDLEILPQIKVYFEGNTLDSQDSLERNLF